MTPAFFPINARVHHYFIFNVSTYRKSDEFDIFTFGDKNECGTWVCKRVFDIKNNLIKKPAKFSWLNDGMPKASPNWDLYDLIAIRDDRYIGVLTQSNTKARLDYLTERGADIKSMETFVNFFRDMKLQSSISKFTFFTCIYALFDDLNEYIFYTQRYAKILNPD